SRWIRRGINSDSYNDGRRHGPGRLQMITNDYKLKNPQMLVNRTNGSRAKISIADYGTKY
ncbi:19824_t:CDS:1, partial [Rhizophagus irregularis]